MVTRKGTAVVAAGLLLAVAGCGGGGADGGGGATGKGAPSSAVPRPSGALVKWMGGMCGSTAELGAVREDSAADLEKIRHPDDAGVPAEFLATGYLSRTPSRVEDVQRDLEGLGRSGVPAADRLLGAWLKKLKGVVTELDEVSPSAAFDDAEGSAAGVDKLVRTLTEPEPGLSELTKRDPLLAAAHRSAARCDSGRQPAEGTSAPDGGTPAPATTGPLPEAADGENFGACADGRCEVLVTSTADITANGLRVHVTAGDDYVTFVSAGTVMQLGGAGGEAGFGDDLTATVVAQNEDGAVLRFTIP